MSIVNNASELRLTYTGDVTATCRDGWHWFTGSMKDVFSKKMLWIAGILLCISVLNIMLGWVPLFEVISLSCSIGLVYIWLVEQHYHGSCSFATLMHQFGARFVRIFMYTLVSWVADWVLNIIGFLIIFILYGSEIISFVGWFREFLVSNDVLSHIGSSSSEYWADLVNKFVKAICDYLFYHGAVFFHAFIAATVFITIGFISFMLKFFAVPLTMYGDVPAHKALWISFKSCTKNWLSLSVAYFMLWLVKSLLFGPVLVLLLGLSGFSLTIGAVESLMSALVAGQFLGIIIVPILGRVLLAVDYFIAFRACRTIFWQRYDELLKDNGKQQ